MILFLHLVMITHLGVLIFSISKLYLLFFLFFFAIISFMIYVFTRDKIQTGVRNLNKELHIKNLTINNVMTEIYR